MYYIREILYILSLFLMPFLILGIICWLIRHHITSKWNLIEGKIIDIDYDKKELLIEYQLQSETLMVTETINDISTLQKNDSINIYSNPKKPKTIVVARDVMPLIVSTTFILIGVCGIILHIILNYVR